MTDTAPTDTAPTETAPTETAPTETAPTETGRAADARPFGKCCQILPLGYAGSMTTMNISLPDDMKEFVDQQVRARGFMSSSEYIRDLIRHERELAEFRAKIQEGIDSGEPIPAETVMVGLRAKLAAHK